MTFLYSHWLELPLSTRHTIAQALNIPRTGHTEVSDNRVVKDGYSIQDVELGLSLEKLQAYTFSTLTDMQVLWKLMVDRAEGRDIQPEAQPAVIEDSGITVDLASMVPMSEETPVPVMPDLGELPIPDDTTTVVSIPAKPRGRPKKNVA